MIMGFWVRSYELWLRLGLGYKVQLHQFRSTFKPLAGLRLG